MAVNKNQDNKDPNPSNIQDYQSIQSALGNIADLYKKINDDNGTWSTESKNISSNFTKINNLIAKTIEISSKIGVEYIRQNSVRTLSKNIEAKINELKQKENSLVKDLGAGAKKYVGDVIKQRAELQKVTAEEMKIAGQILIQKEGSKDIAALEQARAGKTLRREALEKKLAEDLNNQHISSVLATKDQIEQLNLVKQRYELEKKDIAKSNRDIRAGNFWKELLSKIPVINKFADLPVYMEKFGKFGTVGIAAVTGLVAVGATLIATLFKASNQVSDFRRNFALTREDAVKLRYHLFSLVSDGNIQKLAGVSEDLLFTQQDVIKALDKINSLFGTAVILNDKQLAQFTAISETLGLSEEAMKGLVEYSGVTGKNFTDIQNTVFGVTAVMESQRGLMVNQKTILDTVLKTSGGVRANFKGSVQELTKAVYNAKLMGLSLEQVQHTAEGLLDFESSISNQLEAELLTGRKMNLERARAAALTGDMNTVMSEMNKQIGSQHDFLKMNVIAQNALAKTMGMTRDQMSDMLFQQGAINALVRAGNNDAKASLGERYDQLVKQYGVEQAILRIGNDQIASNLQIQSAQEKFAKIMERLQDLFGRLFEGGSLERALTSIGGFVEYMNKGGSILGALFHSDAYEATQARIAKEVHVKDAVISPSGKLSISTPYGKLIPAAGDSIVTTPNPGGMGGGKELTDKLDKMIMLLERGGNVYMDSKKVGTTQALAFTAYK